MWSVDVHKSRLALIVRKGLLSKCEGEKKNNSFRSNSKAGSAEFYSEVPNKAIEFSLKINNQSGVLY